MLVLGGMFVGYAAASVVGGSFSGGAYPAEVTTFTWNFSSRAADRCGEVGHPYITRSALSPAFTMSSFEEDGDMKTEVEFSRVCTSVTRLLCQFRRAWMLCRIR